MINLVKTINEVFSSLHHIMPDALLNIIDPFDDLPPDERDKIMEIYNRTDKYCLWDYLNGEQKARFIDYARRG